MERSPEPMAKSSKDDPWKGWVADLARMGAASQRAEDEYLKTLSLEDGLRLFEELCDADWGFEGPFAEPFDDDPPPVTLARLWRDPR